MPISGVSPDQVWSEVDLWLDVDVFVARFCDGSDAPLHVLSVESELCFGDVVVEHLDGLGIVCALLVGDVLAGEVRRALAFCLVLRDVLAPFECAFAEAPGALGGDDGDLAEGRRFAGVVVFLPGLGDLDADACVRVGVLSVMCDGDWLGVVGAGEDGGHGEVDGLGDSSFPCNGEVGDLTVDARVMCWHDASLLEVHCVACAGCVSCEDGVGSVVCLCAASTGVACLRPEDMGVVVPRVVDDVSGHAAVRLVPVAFEVDEVGVWQVGVFKIGNRRRDP